MSSLCAHVPSMCSAKRLFSLSSTVAWPSYMVALASRRQDQKLPGLLSGAHTVLCPFHAGSMKIQGMETTLRRGSSYITIEHVGWKLLAEEP
jgi:hypothetical protein